LDILQYHLAQVVERISRPHPNLRSLLLRNLNCSLTILIISADVVLICLTMYFVKVDREDNEKKDKLGILISFEKIYYIYFGISI
jgi:hypothetical protein